MNGNPEVSRLDQSYNSGSPLTPFSLAARWAPPVFFLRNCLPRRNDRPPCGFSRSVGVSSYRAGGVSVLRRTAESAGVQMGLTACPKVMVVAVSSQRIPVSIRSRRSFDES